MSVVALLILSSQISETSQYGMHMQKNFGSLKIYYVTYNRSVVGYSVKIAAGYLNCLLRRLFA